MSRTAASEVNFAHVTFISAGAGSGKTYRLTEELQRVLTSDTVDPARIVGMTFTVKAAAELRDRVCQRLLAGGDTQLAELTSQALIGTVHSVCERILKRFSFELGLSPMLNVLSLEDGSRLFNQALDDTLALDKVRQMNGLAARLGQDSWQAAVKSIADKIRENNLSAEQIPAMALSSADALLAHFPPATTPVSLEQLSNAVAQACADIDLQLDTTKKTADYLTLLQQSQQRLLADEVPWDLWIQLSVASGGKRSESAARQVRDAATGYAGHAEFHNDARTYIEQIMSIAAATIDRFQLLKTQRGLIDFLDMEQLTLLALDDAAVSQRLQQDIDLLMVDEFQDTNPMQLALYIKLAQLADRVILVGDVKQAIYAFRGCDPDLVFNTLEGMSAAAAETDVLTQNWRSRPGLVHFVNELFKQAFAGEIPAQRVVLAPARKQDSIQTEIFNWRLQGAKSQRARAIAEGLYHLVSSGYTITDPQTLQQRAVQWGDIAILARTNSYVEDIARTLADCQIPMKMTLQGLLSVPEVCLARACLRRVNDASDTLATAEILSLAEAAEPQDWLAERLRSVAEEQPSHQWAEDTHEVIGRLAELAADSTLRSPLEVVARVLHDVGVRRVVTRWGPDAVKVAQRQKNLDAFLDLAVQYEGVCESQYQAATLTGFLFWLENPASPELDLQPVVTSGNAVHVLTYHRAKGLEWPVVVVTDFESKDRSVLWDARIQLSGVFDVAAPLANRSLRFWPNVFGRRSRGVQVLENIQQSPEAQFCMDKSAAENRRLAYVGMTRARDALIIAVADKDMDQAPLAGTWLDTFHSEFMFRGSDDRELLLPGGERCLAETRAFSGAAVNIAAEAYQPRWFAERVPADLPAATVNPSAAAPDSQARIGRIIELGSRLPLHSDNMTALGSALHTLIAAEFVNPAGSRGGRRAEGILTAFEVQQNVQAEQAWQAAARLHHVLHEQFAVEHAWVEYPLTHTLADGRVVRGFVDLLVELPDAWLLIDHKSSPQPRSAWPQLVMQHAGQLQMYADAIAAISSKPVRQFLHFVVAGALVEINRDAH